MHLPNISGKVATHYLFVLSSLFLGVNWETEYSKPAVDFVKFAYYFAHASASNKTMCLFCELFKLISYAVIYFENQNREVTLSWFHILPSWEPDIQIWKINWEVQFAFKLQTWFCLD